MARDYLTLGPTPCDENCEGVGMDNYSPDRARKESNVYKRQLQRMFPDRPAGLTIVVKSFPHDFGSYLEVCAVFDDRDEKAVDFAVKMEGSIPQKWDEIAKIELLPPLAETLAQIPQDLLDGPESRYPS